MTDRREAGPMKFWTTMGATIGGTLVSALLLWIGSNQLKLSTGQAVIQRDLQAQATLILENNNLRQRENKRLEELFGRVWPRLRSLQQNQIILSRELEEICDCEIELQEPEKF